MFWKLCKFEWKCSYRSYMFLYAVLLISSLCMNFGKIIDTNNTALNITVGIVMIVYGVSLTSLLIMAFVNVIRNYYQSMFKKNSYLTHTLPVPSWMLVLSKLLAGLFWILLSVCICFISVILIVLNVSEVHLFEIFDAIARATVVFPILDVLRFSFEILISFAELVSLFYFVMTAANTKYVQRNRGVAAIFIFLVISIIEGVIGNFFMYHPSTFSLQMNLITTIGTNSIFSICITLFMTCVWFFGNVYLLDHKMEIE